MNAVRFDLLTVAWARSSATYSVVRRVQIHDLEPPLYDGSRAFSLRRAGHDYKSDQVLLRKKSARD